MFTAEKNFQIKNNSAKGVGFYGEVGFSSQLKITVGVSFAVPLTFIRNKKLLSETHMDAGVYD